MVACGGIGVFMIASRAGVLYAGFKIADEKLSPGIDAMYETDR